jgi:hypothetical protein
MAFYINNQKEYLMKTFSKVTLLLALALALSLIACDDEEDDPPVDDPKPQSATITFGANNSLSTNVTGHMTDAQWDNVIGKLTTALNAAATAEPGFCTSMFGAGVNINLVKTQEYSYYKINVEGKIFSLNADYVIGATQADLSAKVSTAINAPFTGGSLQQ